MMLSDQEGDSSLFFRKQAGQKRPRKRGPRPKQATRVVRAEKTFDRINQELYKRNAELAVRNKTLALLRQLDEVSIRSVGVQELAKTVTGDIATALGYDVVSIAMMHEKAAVLQWVGISSAVPWIADVVAHLDIHTVTAPLRDDLVSIKALHDHAFQFADAPQQVYPASFVADLIAADQSPTIEEVKYSLVYPLRFGDNVLGVLTLSSSRSLQNISGYEQDAVKGIVGLVALAMYKAKIYEDLQRTSKQLSAANKQLKELDQAKSEFLSIASHQLYTPLTALRGYISMLKEGDFGAVPPKQDSVLDILNQSAVRLIDLIKGLLDISRIERGKLELNLQSLDVAELAKELVQDLMPNAMKKNLKLEFHPASSDVPHVVADRDRLRQVMLNFIDNAIKYTMHGRVDVSVTGEDGRVMFAVQDTGRGISQSDSKLLFQKFVRVGGAARFHTEGTGLGLYVAQQIVREHHGEIAVTSPGEGHGSTFSVALPAAGSAKSLQIGQKTVEIKAAES